ncbi:MAG TPA: glycosyltransferase [Flavobacterium sp.]|jgi:hypothetical protein
MIPKKIHYCWLSNDPFPPAIEKTIASWKRHLPEYEFILWDTNRFPLADNTWVRQAFEARKYAFAADYIRLFAVYNHGGIYLDTDVEVRKSFIDLLDRPYFIGSEGGGIIEAGIFGAEKGCQWVGDCLDYYDGKSFIKADGSFDMMTLPRIMMSQITKSRKIEEVTKETGVSYTDDTLIMFPEDYFCAKNQGTGIIKTTENTYTIHHFAMSWKPKNKTFLADMKRKLISIFGKNLIYGFIKLFRLKEIRSSLVKK